MVEEVSNWAIDRDEKVPLASIFPWERDGDKCILCLEGFGAKDWD